MCDGRTDSVSYMLGPDSAHKNEKKKKTVALQTIMAKKIHGVVYGSGI